MSAMGKIETASSDCNSRQPSSNNRATRRKAKTPTTNFHHQNCKRMFPFRALFEESPQTDSRLVYSTRGFPYQCKLGYSRGVVHSLYILVCVLPDMYAHAPQHFQGKWRASDFLLAQCSLASIIFEAGLRIGIHIPVFAFYLDRMTGHRACYWDLLRTDLDCGLHTVDLDHGLHIGCWIAYSAWTAYRVQHINCLQHCKMKTRSTTRQCSKTFITITPNTVNIDRQMLGD